MKTRDVLTSHLISFMEKQEHDCWNIKDIEFRYIYANKAMFFNSCLPMNFNIEGCRPSECPASWSENSGILEREAEIIQKLGKPIYSIVTHISGKEQTFRSFFVEKFPYFHQNEIIGTLSHSKKISPRLLSEAFFKNPTTPSFLTNHPPNNLFTTEELNVFFFVMKLMSNQEIALRLGTYSCVVEQIIQQIYKKIDIYTRKQLRDYGIAEGFDNYFPPFLLKGLL